MSLIHLELCLVVLHNLFCRWCNQDLVIFWSSHSHWMCDRCLSGPVPYVLFSFGQQVLLFILFPPLTLVCFPTPWAVMWFGHHPDSTSCYLCTTFWYFISLGLLHMCIPVTVPCVYSLLPGCIIFSFPSFGFSWSLNLLNPLIDLTHSFLPLLPYSPHLPQVISCFQCI